MKKREAGQGLVEYAIILALISIVVVAVLRLLGPKIGNTFSTIDHQLEVSIAPNIWQLEAKTNSGFGHGHGNDLSDIVEPLKEAGLQQEEQFHEGIDITVEAFADSLEVIIEHFDEIGKDDTADHLSVLRQAFLEGDFEAIPVLLESLPADLGNVLTDLPEEVQITIAEKMLARLAESSEKLAQGIVSPDIVTGTIATVEQEMPDDHPNKTDLLQNLNEAGDLILARNEAIEEIISVQDKVMIQLQTLLDSQ